MNDYLKEYQEVHATVLEDYDKWTSSYRARETLTKKYAWAIPTDEALDCLAKYAPLVEIGAGTGYWAHLLRQRGVRITAYDQFPPDGHDWEPEGANDEYRIRKNWYHRGHETHTEVLSGTQHVLKRYNPDWNLFLCWPPMTNMAIKALKLHKGKYLCYIGEGDYGCNANNAFFDYLGENYEQVEGVQIPQWEGLHDYLDIYKKKGG